MTGSATPEAAREESRGFAATAAENVRHVWANPNVRRIQLAFVGSETGAWAYGMAMLVWAYQEGGAGLVGVWAGVRLLLAAVAAPLGGALADRMSRRTFMLLNDGSRLVLTLVTAAAIFLDLGVWAVLVPATLVTLIGASFRSAQAGLLPSLVDSPRQLTAANATAEIVDSTAAFGGPALAGVLLGAFGIVPVVILNCATFAWSMLLVLGVRSPREVDRTPEPSDSDDDADGESAESVWAEVTGGFRAIGADRDMLATAGLMGVNGLLGGALSVVIVILAAEALGDPAAVGWINAILGAASFAGGLVMLALAGRVRLGRFMVIGVLGWSVPFVVMGMRPDAVVIIVAATIIGMLDPMVNVGFATVPARLVPDRVLSRVFAAIESIFIATAALGSFLAPLLVAQFGFGVGIAALGLIGVAVALLCATRMPSLDGRLATPRGLDLLAAVPLFQPLSPQALEMVAHKLVPVSAEAGDVILAEGAESDRFYIIESGTVAITRADQSLGTEGAGDVFGEIGLLFDRPRTASVTAVGPVQLLTLSREDFLSLMAGEERVRGLTAELASRRLAV